MSKDGIAFLITLIVMITPGIVCAIHDLGKKFKRR